MRDDTIQLMCNPYFGEPFVREGTHLVGTVSGRRYPIKNGIPVVLENTELRHQSLYSGLCHDLLAFTYDPIVELGEKIKINTEKIVRQNIISKLDVRPGDRVLETAIGSGSNIRYLPVDAAYYGIDLSYRLLQRARKKLTGRYPNLELIQADGAYVPFRDNTFDLVFHMGGIQFYGDPFRGVNEMARVARPGTRIFVIDEISGAVRTLRRLPAHRRYSTSPQKALEGIKHLVPHSMQEIECTPISETDFYLLSFKKPQILASQQF